MDQKTPIQKFYAGQTIFITGALGFIGKVLVEKLLRSCYDLEGIYVLARPKRGENLKERASREFRKELFDRLASQHPDYMDKIHVVPGDLSRRNIGLCETDIELLKEKITCVFHVAATTNFNAALKEATQVNVAATANIVRFACDMKRLVSFVYVSTAYSNCTRDYVEEKVYQPIITGQKLMELANEWDESEMETVKSGLMGGYTNTYMFTKCVAEEVVLKYGELLPSAIVRPSIVIPTYKEPVIGWADADAMLGTIGVTMQIALGNIRCMHGDINKKSDIVPADMLANHILAVAWDLGAATHSGDDVQPSYPLVYNFVSTTDNPITWGKCEALIKEKSAKYASTKMSWYCRANIMTPHWLLYTILNFVLHTVPAYVMDWMLMLNGRKPNVVRLYGKFKLVMDYYSFVLNRDWIWENANVKKLFNKMAASDKAMFNFDVSCIDWDEMFENFLIGGRIYLMGDPMDTLERGRQRLTTLKYVYYAVLCSSFVLGYLVVYFLSNLIINVTK